MKRFDRFSVNEQTRDSLNKQVEGLSVKQSKTIGEAYFVDIIPIR